MMDFFRKGSLVLATCAADSLKGLALLENWRTKLDRVEGMDGKREFLVY